MNYYHIIGIDGRNAIRDIFDRVIKGDIANASFYEPYEFPNRVIKFLYKVYYARKGRRFFRIRHSEIWRRWHVLERFKPDPNHDMVIVFAPGLDIDRLIDLAYIKKKKEQLNAKMVLLLFDSIGYDATELGWNKVTGLFDGFDYVMTFDKHDAERYGIDYFLTPYDAVESIDIGAMHLDGFFVGYDKGRIKMIERMADYFDSKGINYMLCVAKKRGKNRNKGIVYLRERMPYEKVVSVIDKSNCIIDLVCKGQEGPSLRYYEAVVYGKKLLTNNPGIKEYPFYNDRFMKIFEDVQAIDCEWIKEETDVSYDYNGSFSTESFFENLDRITGNSRHLF